jgi:oligopeptide/dipeptide ABC transporter ATP-binding protein
MDKILEVKNLKISFRTNSGIVRAVRDISLDLEKGKTLAIVGESGSGKSVTSKAILGILAGNSIVEGGEILYDGMDLLKIDEEQMHKVRGDKISMIFQDPLSSLNPIVKIGNQITEATLLKNKANRREARNQFNSVLALLRQAMVDSKACSEEKAKEMCGTFDTFCIKANKFEHLYNVDDEVCEDCSAHLKDLLFKAEKNQKQNVKYIVGDVLNKTGNFKSEFFVHEYKEKLANASKEVKELLSDYKPTADNNRLGEKLENAIKELDSVIEAMYNQTKPNFFRIGFYALKNPNEDIYSEDTEALNEKALKFLDENFMLEFLEYTEKALKYSAEKYLAKKREAVKVLQEQLSYFDGTISEKESKARAKVMTGAVLGAIDPLEIKKDNRAYTFDTGINDAVNRYFRFEKQNPKEQARFDKQTAKVEKLKARGKKVDWKVVPANIVDLDLLKKNISNVINGLIDDYSEFDKNFEKIAFSERKVEIVDFFKDRASKVVYKITRSMAKENAIKLMEEVGISEPRMRYNQYPFEFSGGMRQRIVIAIALTADPEILICDEPTTALDVTIQAQILELINDLKKKRNLSIIFITHDLGVVANMADDIAVMYAGKIVEQGTASDVFYDPRHPYTWALLSSMPDLDTKEKLESIPGTPPNMIYPPVGDAFADRNKYAMQIDYEMQPPMFEISETHRAATWLLHPDAPKLETPAIIRDRIARMKAKNNNGGEING